MKRIFVPAVAVFLIGTSAAQAQMPVTDGVAIVDRAKSYLQDIKQYALATKSYITQAQQYATELQSYWSFVQNPTLGAALGLMNQSGLGNDLPINPYSLTSLTSGYSMSLNGLGGKLAALSSLANDSYSQSHIYDCTNGSWACDQQRQNAFGLAGRSGIARAAYQNLRDHMPVVQALRDRAASATTPAERENVLVALASEQAWHDNLMAQVNSAEMEARTAMDTRQQRQDESLSRDINDVVTRIPGG